MQFDRQKTPLKKKLQQYEGGGRAPGPLALVEATALAKVVDKST